MKKLLLIFICWTLSQTVLGQVKFITNNDPNGMTFPNCKINHEKILTAYQQQTSTEISRLVDGIEYETYSKTPRFKIKAYYHLLANLLTKRIMIDEMTKQLNSYDWNNKKQIQNQQIFKLDKIKINIDSQIKTLTEAHKEKELPTVAVNEFKEQLEDAFFDEVKSELFKAIGKGLLARVSAEALTASALRSSLISFGSNIVMSAAKDSLISLLTMPLHGYRLPPEEEWINLLKQNSELIINPQWMKDAGSQDHPWFTHCIAMHRKTERMEKILNTLFQKEEKSFVHTVTLIHKLEKPKDKIEYDPRMLRDNTYVRPVQLEDFPPFWATKN